MLDELADIRDLDATLAKPDRRMVPFEVTSAILDGVSPIRAWREHRGLAPDDLAKAAGIEPSDLAQLEAKKRAPTNDELQSLGKALRAHADDLVDPPPQ